MINTLTRAILQTLSIIAFVFATLLLLFMTHLAFSGEAGILGRIELGVMAFGFYLAAIYLKPSFVATRKDY